MFATTNVKYGYRANYFILRRRSSIHTSGYRLYIVCRRRTESSKSEHAVQVSLSRSEASAMAPAQLSSTLPQSLKDLDGRISNLETKLSSGASQKQVSSTNENPENAQKASANGSEVAENDAFLRKMHIKALASGFRDYKLKRCPDRYYDVSLDERKEILGASSREMLCKSIVMENTRCTRGDCSDPLNSKYYCIVTQYTRKLNGEKVFRFVRGLNSDRGIPRKAFNFQLARDSASVTGFDYNAVSPLGMKTKMPIILAKEITELDPPEFWLGGGEVSLKWRVTVEDFRNAFNPFVADLCFENGENGENEKNGL